MIPAKLSKNVPPTKWVRGGMPERAGYGYDACNVTRYQHGEKDRPLSDEGWRNRYKNPEDGGGLLYRPKLHAKLPRSHSSHKKWAYLEDYIKREEWRGDGQDMMTRPRGWPFSRKCKQLGNRLANSNEPGTRHGAVIKEYHSPAKRETLVKHKHKIVHSVGI